MDIDGFIIDRVKKVNISCRTLIVTIFGDVVSQHGNWIWLGSLIDSLNSLGYSERLVRTSVYRLVKEDWLQVKKIGRKSYYRFTKSANNHYIKAARRIYASNTKSSNNRWLIVLPSFVNEQKIMTLKRQLKWLGFSSLHSGVFAHPCFDQGSLEETLNELDLTDSVIIFSAETIDKNSAQVLKKLVYEKWELEKLLEQYDGFLKTYQPIFDGLTLTILANKQSFLLRVLLIHEYRRILLKDHELSCGMLPKNWSGYKVNEVVKEIYSLLARNSCKYISNKLEAMDGSLLMVSKEFSKRFK